MYDPRVQRMAEVLVHYSLAVKPKDQVLIQGSDLATPILKAVYREVLRAGGYPDLQVGIEGISEIFYKEANEDQLKRVSPLRQLTIEQFDCLVNVGGTHNARELSGVDPAKQAIASRAMAPLTARLMERAAKGALRWVRTEFPTQAVAQEAGMSLSDYAEFVFSACRLDAPDPVAAWREVHKTQARIATQLNEIDELRIVAPDTDLTLRVGGRRWINADGKHNFPDGEVFTGPIEDSAHGHIRFSFPGIFRGTQIEDIRLRFEGGKVVEASARQGEELLLALLDSDPGARFLGEIGIGTNFQIRRFSKHMLFDEKIGGTVHLAIGAGYPETGSTNKSGVHWDMLCDLRSGGEIYGDGRLIYREGRFLF